MLFCCWWCVNNIISLIISFLFVPNEFFYSICFLINLIFKNNILFSQLCLSKFNFSLMYNAKFIIEILFNLISIIVSILSLDLINSSCSPSNFYYQLFCVLFLTFKFFIKLTKFLYYDLFTKKYEFSIRHVIDKNLNEKLLKVIIRYF